MGSNVSWFASWDSLILYLLSQGNYLEYFLSLLKTIPVWIIKYTAIWTKDQCSWGILQICLDGKEKSCRFQWCATKCIHWLTLAGWNLGQLISDCLNAGYLALVSQKLKATNPKEVFTVSIRNHPEKQTYLVTFSFWLIAEPYAVQCNVH